MAARTDAEVDQGGAATRDEAEQACRTNLNFLASFCMPGVATSEFPPFYVEVWNYLVKEMNEREYGAVFRFALGLPRGHVKTTLIKLLVFFALIYELSDFLVVVCATEPLAQNFLADVREILVSDNVAMVYGNIEATISKDTKELIKLRYNGRNLVLAAIGSGSSPRGLNIGNARPDLLIFDDAQTDKNDESPTDRARLMRWITSTIKLKGPKGITVIYIGNMYSEECILNKLAKSPQWNSLITGAILADGTALWEEIWPIDALIADYMADESVGEGDTWFAEVQNDPSGKKGSLLPDGAIPSADIPADQEPLGAFLTIDPAGNKKNSDDNVISVHVVWSWECIEIVEISAGNFNPEQVIIKAIALASKWKASVIFPEGVAYQASLAFWMDKYLASTGLADQITVVPIHPGKANKTGRIRMWIKVLLAGSYIVRNAEVRAMIVWQALQFKVDRTDNKDDILDCCCYGEKVRNDPELKALVFSYQEVLQNPADDAKVVEDNTYIDNFTRRST